MLPPPMTADLARLTAIWPFPTTVRFGPGRIAELGKTCARLGFKRPLLVTDAGLAATAGGAPPQMQACYMVEGTALSKVHKVRVHYHTRWPA